MAVNRRSFISGLIRVGAFAAFDPQRVIFDMGRKLFVPQVWRIEYHFQQPSIEWQNLARIPDNVELTRRILGLPSLRFIDVNGKELPTYYQPIFLHLPAMGHLHNLKELAGY